MRVRIGVVVKWSAVLLAAALGSPLGPARAEDAPAPPASAPKKSAAARVVAAIAAIAQDNAALEGKRRVEGDALADAYVRKAATACEGDAQAFWVGLTKSLDPTGTLERFPLTARAFADLETDDEAQARRANMGVPTLRGRNDRLLHFVVSGTLASRLGEGLANAAGVAKELSDLKTSKKFSIGDLLADRAGIVFARRLATGDVAKNLAWVAVEFTGAAVIPDDAGLPDALPKDEFEKAYGGATDPRFVAEQARLAALTEALPYLRPAPAPPASVAPGAGMAGDPPSDGRREPSPTK